MPSTVISSFNYDVATATLTIAFTTGKVYQYFKVPETVYLEMKGSFSKGIYFNEEIKGKYAFKKRA